MLTSRLFLKTFATIVVIVVVHAALLNFLTVPLITRTLSDTEENAGQTILQSVYDLASRMHTDIAAFEEYATEAHRRELKSIVHSMEFHIQSVYRQSRLGRITEAEAKRRILEEVTDFRYGDNNYVFIVDFDALTVAHPKPGQVGQNMSRVTDAKGKFFIPEMIRASLASPDGVFTRYWWARLGSAEALAKLTFSKVFKPWRWVVGTGVYLDDVQKEVAKRKNHAVEELRRLIRGIRIANTGYLYIFDSKYNLIIHPNKTLEGTNISAFKDTSSGRPLSDVLMDASRRPDHRLVYKWDKPNDLGHYVYDKIAWVKHLECFDWYIASSVYVEELGRTARILRGEILIMGILVLLLSIGLGYFFIHRLVRPIETLSGLAKRVRDGDLSVQCGITRADEIGELASSFDAMIAELRKNIETLDGKVRERTVDLEKACNELRHLDEMKSTFLSTVSHELRTPMTSVLGFACIIRQKLEEVIFPQIDRSNPKNEKAIGRILENLGIVVAEGERLTEMVNDFLDLSKMEAGKTEWKAEPVDVGEVVARAAAATSGLFVDRDLVFRTEIGDGLPTVIGDPDRLIRVVINLISNAVKFTSRGTVTCRVSFEAGAVTTSVVDTGGGIAPEDLGQVFEKFKQVGDTLTGKPRGTGLGLPICRQIVEHHGGRIWVESELGQGSAFRFSLPLVPPAGDGLRPEPPGSAPRPSPPGIRG